MTPKAYKKILDLLLKIQEGLELCNINTLIAQNPNLEKIYAQYFYMLNTIFSDAFGHINAADIERFIFDGEGDKNYIYNIANNDNIK